MQLHFARSAVWSNGAATNDILPRATFQYDTIRINTHIGLHGTASMASVERKYIFGGISIRYASFTLSFVVQWHTTRKNDVRHRPACTKQRGDHNDHNQ
jgi:hypothetical protein